MTSLPVSKNEVLLEAWRKTLNDEIVHSPCKPINTPIEPLASRAMKSLLEHAQRHPQKPAVIDALNQTRFLTYQQIHDQSLSVAAFLRSQGFSVGDRACTVLANCIEFPVILLGVWSAGGVFVGSSPAFKHHESVYQLRDSGSSVVFTSEVLLRSVLSAAEECPEIKTIVCIRTSSALLPSNVIDFQDVINFAPLKEIVPVSMDAPCMVYYSSGTTGQPKGVVHTNFTYYAGIEILRSHFLDEIYPVLGVMDVDWYQDSQIISTGCFHMLGFGLLNWCLLTGAQVVMMEKLDELLYPKLVDKFKPRYLFVSPPIFAYLSKDPKGRAAALESVHLILTSSSPLSQEISDEFFAHHPNVKYIVQGYGMTETGYSHLPLLTREGATASSGVLASGFQQKIINTTTHQSCALGEWGEILVKSPSLTIGYLNKEEETKFLFDDEGWLHTGDIGYMDHSGSICIVDRVKELIKVNYANQTLQVPPAELEGILLSTPSIRDVAIVGVPHEAGGELVFIVKAEENLEAEDVERVITDKLAPFKRITGGVVFLDAIPRSASGKILRRQLKEIC
ncbi:hypothetical protein PRIPAC_76987 [Pristionchus pacificus]|uniref:AMP-binding protein n=1 Tax=Pristionchus pacificus TaxID=54126 RepID=A0A2A6CL51_PRIPA|nr:hypothetical protein PRIPAC_76987 [Pristionchus pacificus]|eukprot:PDM78846.1 AMP-binding protein [Pristionchus pacificus]